MELDFTSEVLEKLLFKRILVDKNWLNIVENVFDKRWFKVPCLGSLFQIVLSYHKKYSQIPSTAALQQLVKALLEKSHDAKYKLADFQQLLLDIQNLELNIDEEIVSTNLKEFIRRSAFYNALYDNAELLEKKPENYEKVVDKCLANFDRV